VANGVPCVKVGLGRKVTVSSWWWFEDSAINARYEEYALTKLGDPVVGCVQVDNLELILCPVTSVDCRKRSPNQLDPLVLPGVNKSRDVLKEQHSRKRHLSDSEVGVQRLRTRILQSVTVAIRPVR